MDAAAYLRGHASPRCARGHSAARPARQTSRGRRRRRRRPRRPRAVVCSNRPDRLAVRCCAPDLVLLVAAPESIRFTGPAGSWRPSARDRCRRSGRPRPPVARPSRGRWSASARDRGTAAAGSGRRAAGRQAASARGPASRPPPGGPARGAVAVVRGPLDARPSLDGHRCRRVAEQRCPPRQVQLVDRDSGALRLVRGCRSRILADVGDILAQAARSCSWGSRAVRTAPQRLAARLSPSGVGSRGSRRRARRRHVARSAGRAAGPRASALSGPPRGDRAEREADRKPRRLPARGDRWSRLVRTRRPQIAANAAAPVTLVRVEPSAHAACTRPRGRQVRPIVDHDRRSARGRVAQRPVRSPSRRAHARSARKRRTRPSAAWGRLLSGPATLRHHALPSSRDPHGDRDGSTLWAGIENTRIGGAGSLARRAA